MSAGKNRIMIFGPKDDGTYVVEFRTTGEALAISIPRTEAHVIRYFQQRMPYGLFVPEVMKLNPFGCVKYHCARSTLARSRLTEPRHSRWGFFALPWLEPSFGLGRFAAHHCFDLWNGACHGKRPRIPHFRKW